VKKLIKFSVLITLFISTIYLGISLNFSNANLKDVLNEITNQSKINFIYPSTIESLKVSINLAKTDLDTTLKLLLLPLNLDFEKVSENTYVIYSLENISKERYVGEYTIKYTNPRYLTELIESMGYYAYSYNGKIYFYTPTKNSYERVVKLLENMDFPKSEDVLLVNVKYYSKSDISSTAELNTQGIGIIDSITVFEKLKAMKEVFTFVNMGELYKESKKLLSLDDLLEIEVTQVNSSNCLVIKTKESAINIDVSKLLSPKNANQAINYIVKVENGVFLTNFQVLKVFDGAFNQDAFKLSTIPQIQKKGSQKSEKTLLSIYSNPAISSLQIGTERLNSIVSFKNSDFTLSNVELCVSLFDNVYTHLDYNLSEKEIGLSISDNISTNFVYLYSKLRYNVTKNEFSLSTKMGLKLRTENFEILPLISADGKEGLFYGIAMGLHQGSFSGEILILLNSQIQVTWGLKLVW